MRIFKTKWFASQRGQLSRHFRRSSLYQVIQSALQRKVADFRGGAGKKRLNKNRDRAIILTKSAEYWFYTFLYAKQDMANINHRELMGFRELAKHYANLSEEKTTALVKKVKN
ncbi:type II toxin-antitoxin system RelE/ParE family toxin [Klebsiella pneumoniae]|nr:type II toxin-antitoxin system RelE/ParE family toxin [Klebsiella pneumoniae]